MTIIIYCDNKSTIQIVANPVFHKRTKHIEINFHVVREKVLAGTIHLMHVITKEQVADIFTKSLHPDPFNTLQVKLRMIDMHSNLRGPMDDKIDEATRSIQTFNTKTENN